MDPSNFKTPVNPCRLPIPQGSSRLGLGASGIKRDSLAAELERDPQLSTAKRRTKQHMQTFTSSLSHASLERQLLTAQTTLSETTTKLRERELQIERLERDRRYFAEREKEEREARERERREYEEAKTQHDHALRTLRTTLTALREDHADLVEQHSSLTLQSSQTSSHLKSQLSQLQTQVQLLSSELSESKQLLAQRDATIKELQDELDDVQDANANASMVSVEDQEDMQIVKEELTRQSAYLRSLEATNARLTAELRRLEERNESIEVLKEEKRSLEAKVAVVTDLRERVVRLESELQVAQASSSSPSGSPSSNQNPESTRDLAELRLANARLLEESGSLRAELASKQIELQDALQEVEESRSVIEGLEEDVRSLEGEVRRERARRRVVEGERGWVGGVLESYKAEEDSLSSTGTPAPHASLDTAKLQHLQELETLLQEYKAENERLHEELEELVQAGRGRGKVDREEVERVREEKAVLEEDLKSASSQIAALEARIETLEQTLFDLQGEVAGGRHVPPNVRVLGFGEQPDQAELDVRRETVERMRGENEALLERIRLLEEGGLRVGSGGEGGQGNGEGGGGREGGAGMVPRESWEQVKREKGELEEVVRQKEKRLKRLQEVFASKSAEFREAIASILGLKLAFYPNGQVRVTSMYDLTASFVFQPNSSSGMKMQLVAQSECNLQDLPNLMHYWIECEQCTPGFMASVTLECYDGWKRAREEEGRGEGEGERKA